MIINICNMFIITLSLLLFGNGTDEWNAIRYNTPSLTVRISDAKKNLIKMWKNATVNEYGLHAGQLELGDEPNLGDWILSAKIGEKKESFTFSVAQYILPKVKIEISVPSDITFNSPSIPVQIKAKYTYGKEFIGQCIVRLKCGMWNCRTIHEQSKQISINGTATVEFKHPTYGEGDDKANPEIEAIILDSKTDEELEEENVSTFFSVYRYPYKIQEIEKEDKVLEGSKPYLMVLKVTSQDGRPVHDQRPQAIQLTHGNFVFNSPIPPNGIVNFTLTPPSELTETHFRVQVVYKGMSARIYLRGLRHVSPRGERWIQLKLANTGPESGEDLALVLQTTSPFTSFNYILLSWSKDVFKTEQITIPTPTTEFKFKVNIPENLSRGKILVFLNSGSGETKEMIATSLDLNIPGVSPLKNKLEIELDTKELEPGKNVSIMLRTQGHNSLIALRAVDQSLVIRENDRDTDIDQNTISGRVHQIEYPCQAWEYRNQEYTEAARLFDVAGLAVLTNNAGLKNPSPRVSLSKTERQGLLKIQNKKPKGKTEKKMTTKDEMAVRMRDYFPEAWIFDEFHSPGSSININTIVPDTLTSWMISGFALNPELGLGLCETPQQLTTFRQFFLSMDLPFSIVRGESLTIQVFIHNYLEEEVTTRVILYNEEKKFKFDDNVAAESQEKTIVVPSSQVSSVEFTITPTEFGVVMLKVKGFTPLAGDGLIKPLTVKPSGQQVIQSRSTLLAFQAKGSRINTTLKAIFPRERVVGSEDIHMMASPDLIGQAVDNMDNLLRMPGGCCEQNLAGFVADTNVLEYMTSTSTLTPLHREKGIKYLETGYQNQLTYNLADGSASSFGKESVGSTWLTAFVVRSFQTAGNFITVDSGVISRALKFLSARQLGDGSFQELGTPPYSLINGEGKSSGLALSAYTTLAFIEARPFHKGNRKYETQIQRGLDYIGNAGMTNASADTYALNVVAYTLEIANHSKKDELFREMRKRATTRQGDMYWTMSSNGIEASVEMTAYALLTFIHRGMTAESLPIVRWLTKQRNQNGGFHSTQDTVVGLAALTAWSSRTYSPTTDIEINAKYAGEKQLIHVNNEHGSVQEIHLPKKTRELRLEGKGKGTGLAQLSWSYYVDKETKNPAFSVNVTATKRQDGSGELDLGVCAALAGLGKTNMVIIEVSLPSGYNFRRHEVNKLYKLQQVKRLEIKDEATKIIVYFNSLDQTGVCLSVIGNLAFNVANPAKALVFVYDYYDASKSARTFYSVPK